MSSLDPEAPYSGCSNENGCLEVEACSGEELLRDRRGLWVPSAVRTPADT